MSERDKHELPPPYKWLNEEKTHYYTPYGNGCLIDDEEVRMSAVEKCWERWERDSGISRAEHEQTQSLRADVKRKNGLLDEIYSLAQRMEYEEICELVKEELGWD